MTPSTEPGLFDCVIDVKIITDPVLFRKINGWLTIFWFVAAFPICIYLSESVPFLVFISVYAVVTGHLSTWQAARVEARQEQDNTEQIAREIKEALEQANEIADIGE